MSIKYTINNGQTLEFFVPGRNQNMRWAAYSVSVLVHYPMMQIYERVCVRSAMASVLESTQMTSEVQVSTVDMILSGSTCYGNTKKSPSML